MTTEQLSYFLRGIDFGKKCMLEGGEGIIFEEQFPEEEGGTESKVDDNYTNDEKVVDFDKKKEELENEKIAIQNTVEAYQNVINDFQEIMQPEKTEKIQRHKPVTKDEHIFRIAIIDDEVEILEILEDYFSGHGVKCFIYTNFDEFSIKLEEIHVDAVLTDFKMPGKDGLDVLKFVRSKSPMLPVILLSGYLDKNTIIEALGNGIGGVIEKPIDLDNVFSQVKQNALKYKTLKLLNRSIDLLIFNYKNYDDYLKKENKQDERIFLKNEIKNILQLKKQIYNMVG